MRPLRKFLLGGGSFHSAAKSAVADGWQYPRDGLVIYDSKTDTLRVAHGTDLTVESSGAFGNRYVRFP